MGKQNNIKSNKNLIRNNYGNFSRPCLKCEASEPNNLCKIYKNQCADCPLYAKWEKTKKKAHDVKIPLALDDHTHEVDSVDFAQSLDVEDKAKILHNKMKTVLKANEWIVYEALFIQNKEEEEVSILLGFRSSEKNRKPGYKQIKNIRKKIIEKVKKILEKGEIDFI